MLAVESVRDEEERARAALALSCAPLFLCDHQPSIVLVPGHGSGAILKHPAAAEYDSVVVLTTSRILPPPIRVSQAPRNVPALLMADAAPRER